MNKKISKKFFLQINKYCRNKSSFLIKKNTIFIKTNIKLLSNK